MYLTAQLPGSVFLGETGSACATPDQRVVPSARRRHHAVAHRFEDLGFTEIGNQQPERQRIDRRGRAADEGSGAGTAFDQAGVLQVADGAANGDARDGEARHELGLAWQTRPRLPIAALNLPPECREHLAMLDQAG